MRIPGRDYLARIHRRILLGADHGAVGDLVALALAAEVIDHAELARARYCHQVPLLVLHRLHVMEADQSLVAHLAARGGRGPRCRTADVEGAHGELRARLADRLRGDDAYGLADRDRPAARQVTPVAARTDAVTGLAGDGRADLDLVDALLLEEPYHLLIEQRSRRDQHVLRRAGRGDVLRQHAPEHPLAERLHHIAPLEQRGHVEAVARAAVLLGDHQTLGDVDQTPGEIARVGGLEGRVRETLAGAVGGDEVLQDVQALAEVRRDRRLDDRAVGLGHESTHA